MKKTIYFLSVMCLLLSCASEKEEDIQKEEDTKPLLEEGLFSGFFSVTYFADAAWAEDGSGEVTIKLQNGRYYSLGIPNGIPPRGSGTFSVISDNKIRFNDENGWLANFDWGLILDGEYYFEYDGKNLRIWRSINEIALYEYVLERQ